MNDNTIAGVYSNTPQVINSASPTVLTTPTGAAAVVALPSNVRADGHSFSVNLRGKATGGTGATLQFKLYKGTSTTVANDAIVATFAATPALIPVAGGNFDLSLQFIWDATSGTINGIVWGQTNAQITTYGSITAVTGVTDPTTLQFVVVATFGAATATNSVTLSEFTLDQV